MIRLNAILLAAGLGLRLKSSKPKPLVSIGRKPILIHSLLTLSSHPYISGIIVVADFNNKNEIEKEISRYKIGKIIAFVPGGKRRQDSVFNGLNAVEDSADLVLVHDSARPFVDKKLISRVVLATVKNGAAIAGVPVKHTIKLGVGSRESGAIVKETLNRNSIWEIQTPQVFNKSLILEAYKKFGKTEVTDDASLVEKMGAKVSIVMGSYNNIKITTPEDLVIAEMMLKVGSRELGVSYDE